MSSLLDVFQALFDRDLPEGLSRQRLPTAPPLDVYAAVRVPGRHPLVMIGTDEASARSFRPFESEALAARPSEVHGDPVIAIELAELQYLDLFATLSEDLVRRIEGEDARAATGIIATRLERWKDLLNRRRRGLSLEQQRGLIGELRVLRQLLDEPSLPGLAALEAWQGPLGGLHDFLLEHAALEVKAHAPNRSLVINAVDQLWPPETRSRLLLATVEVNHGEGEGVTLEEVVAGTRTLVSQHPAEAAALEERLLCAGWRDTDADKYREVWRVEPPRLYDVAGAEFPRIDPSSVSKGIHISRYQLDPSALADFSVDDQTLTSAATPTEAVKP